MQLTSRQIAEYERDGFVIIPDLIKESEVRRLREELARVASVQNERVMREKTGGPRIIYGLHDCDEPTGSRAFHDLACDDRLFRPAAQILGDADLHLFHSKCNLKEAIEGAIWQWHQDFYYWRQDGVPTANIMTTLVMLDEATEMGGCLYFVPGSHKAGLLEPEWDDKTTSFAFYTVPKPKVIELIERYGDPVPITGGPGTVAFFHPYLLHGSGHNMSARSRWQLYFVYNPVANKARPVADPRPEYQVSRMAKPLRSPKEAVAAGSVA